MKGRVPAESFSPGEIIRDELEAREWTQNDLAQILGRPARLVSEIISGKRGVTPETAIGLGSAFGTSAQFWLNLESAYRLSLTQQDQRERDVVPRMARLFSAAPIKEMVKRGWIAESTDVDVLEKGVCDFFGVKSVDDIDALPFRAAARKSPASTDAGPAQVAWLHRVKQLAMSISVGPYHDSRFDDLLVGLHLLTSSENEVRRIPRFLAEYGIRFVIVEHLSKTRIDGAAMWVDGSPIIACSLRYDRIDGFWFTLAHELGHIKHKDGLDGNGVQLDENLIGESVLQLGEKPEYEKRADAFASNFLVPRSELDSYVIRTKPYFSKESIVRLANRLQIHPGIIVGQLHGTKAILPNHSREMLVKVRAILLDSCLVDGWGSNPN